MLCKRLPEGRKPFFLTDPPWICFPKPRRSNSRSSRNVPWNFDQAVRRRSERESPGDAMLKSGAVKYDSGWWFQTWILFSIIYGNNHPNWLIFFRGVETTNYRILIFEMVWVCPKDFQDALSKSPKHSQAELMRLADPEYGLRPCKTM